MTVAFLTDTHVGCRSGSAIFREYFKFWYEECFFKVLRDKGITHVIHCGDFFDNRNAMTLQDIDFVVNWYAPKLTEYNISMTVILGNHDVAYKNTNKIHSLSVLQAANPSKVSVIEEATACFIDGQRYLLVPWINSSNYDDSIKAIVECKDKPETMILGHFEIQGCKMYASSPLCEHGLSQELFKDFQLVLSGHFHHMSTVGNIKYLGSAFHLTWQDYGDARGFHLYDSSTKTLEFVENEHCLFVKIAFDYDILSKMTEQEYLSSFGGRFIQLIVDGDYDKVQLMDVVSKINATMPHDLKIINNAIVNLVAEEQEDAQSFGGKTVMEYVSSYINRLPDVAANPNILAKMNDAHTKAQELLTAGE